MISYTEKITDDLDQTRLSVIDKYLIVQLRINLFDFKFADCCKCKD